MWGLWKTSSTVSLALHPSWNMVKYVCIFFLLWGNCPPQGIRDMLGHPHCPCEVLHLQCASCHHNILKLPAFVCGVCDPSGRFSAVITPCGVQWSYGHTEEKHFYITASEDWQVIWYACVCVNIIVQRSETVHFFKHMFALACWNDSPKSVYPVWLKSTICGVVRRDRLNLVGYFWQEAL